MRRLLLVEDEAAIASLLEETFVEAGFEVVFASYGDEAMAWLGAEAESLAVLVTDIHLGRGPNGFDVARKARAVAPALPLVFMTGHAEADVEAEGFTDALVAPKPFLPYYFARLVLEHLQAPAGA